MGEDLFIFYYFFLEELVGEVDGGLVVRLHVGWGTREKESDRERLRF